MLINDENLSKNLLTEQQTKGCREKNARAVSEENFDITKHAVICLPNLSEVKAAIAEFELDSFPLYKISMIGSNIPQLEEFTGIAISDRFNATALSIPEDKAEFYKSCIERGHYLIIISASDEDMNKALSIFEKSNIRHWRIYDQTQIVRD